MKKRTFETGTTLFDNAWQTKLGIDLAISRLSINGNSTNKTLETKKTNCHKWLIISCQQSNLYQSLLSQKAADVTAESLHRKGCNSFADHNSTVEQCQTSKRTLSLQKKLLNASCFIQWHFSVVSKREWGAPTSRTQDKRQSPCYCCLCREKEMKQSRLIETKSTPCLCELPFSWLKTLTVGNYSAGEQQSLKLMCNHRLEPDIKANLAIFGSHKHPCEYNRWDHCVPAASLQSLIWAPTALWLYRAGPHI